VTDIVSYKHLQHIMLSTQACDYARLA